MAVSLRRGRRAILAGCSWGAVEKSVLSTRFVVVVRSSLSSSVGGGTIFERENLWEVLRKDCLCSQEVRRNE